MDQSINRAETCPGTVLQRTVHNKGAPALKRENQKVGGKTQTDLKTKTMCYTWKKLYIYVYTDMFL